MKTSNIIIAALFILSPYFLSSCILDDFGIEGEGPIVSESFEMDDFTGIVANGAFEVVIEQGNSYSVVAEGQQNIIDRLELDIKNDDLDIELMRGYYRNYSLVIFVTLPDLEYLKINGSGDVELHQFEDLSSLEIKLNGSGDLREKGTVYANDKVTVGINGSGNVSLDINTTHFEYTQNGSGDLRVYGMALEQEIDMNGSGNYKGFEFKTELCDIKIAGSGNAQLRVKDRLDARIYGSGDISYKDYPAINFSSTGSGDLRDAN